MEVGIIGCSHSFGTGEHLPETLFESWKNNKHCVFPKFLVVLGKQFSHKYFENQNDFKSFQFEKN